MIAAAKADVYIEKKYLKNAWNENPHGMGFMAAKEGKLFLRKGFFNFKSFWKCFREFQDCDKVVHARWANVGKINVENCHPFYVDSDLGMAHNGTISIPTTGEKSDTRTFTERILRKLKSDNPLFLKDAPTRWFLSKSIGNSKLVFLSKDGDITIINKERGEEFQGVWYSNTDYKRWPSKTTTNIPYRSSGYYGSSRHVNFGCGYGV